MDLKNLRNEVQKQIENAENLKILSNIYKKYLGKKGEIAKVFSSLGNLPQKERKKVGQEVNLLKNEVRKIIDNKLKEIKKESRKLKIREKKIDVTIPGQKVKQGHLHPLTLVQREIIRIFESMGFEIVEGPELETEWYNFNALNIPDGHSARDIQDTLWLKQEKSKNSRKNLLMRTQTSPVQIRYMEKHNPPFKIIVPGKVFRNERTDASHDCQFYQCEGLMVDKNISVANFKAIIFAFLKEFFEENIDIRFRPGYFPFTEPSFEIDVRRKKGEWLELMGAGMVHPNVLKTAGLNTSSSNNKWQGFAFGMGIDRLTMVKYNINDTRLFHSGNLKFLNQF